MDHHAIATGSNRFEIERLKGEARIVWLRNPEELPYVRELVWEHFTRRQGCPPKRMVPDVPGAVLVGYSELDPDARHNRVGPGYFTRRIFWLKDYDRALDPVGVYSIGSPIEGVDPLTVAPGVPGRKTSRSSGHPLPSRSEASPEMTRR